MDIGTRKKIIEKVHTIRAMAKSIEHVKSEGLHQNVYDFSIDLIKDECAEIYELLLKEVDYAVDS